MRGWFLNISCPCVIPGIVFTAAVVWHLFHVEKNWMVLGFVTGLVWLKYELVWNGAPVFIYTYAGRSLNHVFYSPPPHPYSRYLVGHIMELECCVVFLFFSCTFGSLDVIYSTCEHATGWEMSKYCIRIFVLGVLYALLYRMEYFEVCKQPRTGTSEEEVSRTERRDKVQPPLLRKRNKKARNKHKKS